MGMCGNYISVTNEELKAVQDGKADIFELCKTEGRSVTDIDKAWDMMSFTFTGEHFGMGNSAEYLVVPMIIDQMLDEYSEEGINAYWLTQAQVKEASAFLADIDEVKLKANFDHDELVANEVYGVHADFAEEDYSYMKEYVFSLRDFYKKAAEENKAVIFWIC